MKISFFRTVATFLFVYVICCCNPVNSNHPSPMNENETKKLWQQVDSLKDVGLSKTALDLVNQIQSRILSERNSPEYLKTILYKIMLSADFEEDHLEKSIAMVDENIIKTIFPASAILNSIQAELYFRYFTANRHLIFDRTIMKGEPGSDIKTWDARAIILKAVFHYLQSLSNAEDLKTFPASNFSMILDEKEGSKNYRPTLFDLLGHRAIDFFVHPQSSLIQANDPIPLNNEFYFEDAVKFSNIILEKPGELSFNYYTLELFRQLIEFHQNDVNPLALIDVDLKRLAWLKDNATFERKDLLYMQALERLELQHINSEAFPELTYAIANELVRIGNSFHPFDQPEPRLKLKEARIKLETAIERFPALPSAKNCVSLLQQITEPSLQLQCEYVNLPDKSFKALVSHKNVSILNLKIIRISPESDRELREKHQNAKDLLTAYLKLDPYKTWKQELPDDGDMQMHNTEIPIQALPLGYYIIIAGFDEEFITEPHTLPFASFWISGLSFVNRIETDGSIRFLVLNRESGKPMQYVTATVWKRQYNPASRRYGMIKGQTFSSSAEGFFLVPSKNWSGQPANLIVELTYNKDRLISDHYFYIQPVEHQKHWHTQTHFFTDRALYRPGQTVFFKGIIIDSDGESHSLKTNYRTAVTLYDANYQKISGLTVTSNDHGSFAGSFVLPFEGLTGNFQLSSQFGSINFSVEDYKLPRFRVMFDTLRSSYKLDESLAIHGQAIAFAGNTVGGAEVRFRITRQVRYPYWDYRSRYNFPFSPPVEIINGTTKTDSDGKFLINFEATPDYSIPKDRNPVFIFNVMADVTDVQGETQSGNTGINIGYVSLLLSADIPGKINRESFTGLRIEATNLNGIPQVVTGEIIVNRLRQPYEWMRERVYARPDRFIIEKAVHDKLFPGDVYDNENDPATWVVEKQMFAGKFNTGEAGILMLQGSGSWIPGTYFITLKSRDAFGEPVEWKKYFTVFAEKDLKTAEPMLWWSVLITSDHKPGQNARIQIGSKTRLTVLCETEINGEIVSSRRLNLSNRSRIIEIPVLENHLGGFRVLLTAVVQNRVFAEAIIINVPDKRKYLKIELETKRNRLEPGGNEQWKVLISDHKGRPATAEMLAGMYDASLDVLKPHGWSLALYDRYHRQFNWETYAAFKLASAYAGIYSGDRQIFMREYDQLNWFGFNMYGFPLMNYYAGGIRFGKGEAMMLSDQLTPEPKAMPVPEATALKEDPGALKPEPIQPVVPSVMIRRDLRETAFFYPQLLSNEDGTVSLNFTVPESLTRWRLMGLAHTKDLKSGTFDEFFESNREVMVTPNPPRFLRQGDMMKFRAKVVNISDKELEAATTLNFFDAVTMVPVNEAYRLISEHEKIVIPPGGAHEVSWDIRVPDDGPYAIIYRIAVVAGSHSDGEENILPVLTNRQLITESLPMFAVPNENRTFTFEKLLQSENEGSTTMHHQLTLEFTTNPVWYAVQSLPYLSEPDYPSAESIFQQYYVNLLALHILKENPEIEKVFEVWQRTDPNALLSNLEKNQDLKSAVIHETPWLNDAIGESERKKQIALLFDRNHIDNMLEKSLKELLALQLSNGAWPWFSGMSDNRYVTQQLVAGLGRLQALGVLKIENNDALNRCLKLAVQYLDEQVYEEYNNIKKPIELKTNLLHAEVVHYMWARSYWIDRFPVSQTHRESIEFWKNQAEKYWDSQPIYLQGMIALAFYRFGVSISDQTILRSLSDRALINEEMGMYWRDLRPGYYWYQAPVETQALLIEAYATIGRDMTSVEKMQQWLIKQKQTQSWKSNRATAEAVYAILMRRTQTLSPNRDLSIQIGSQMIRPATDSAIREEAGTGYIRVSWNRSEIKPEMANISINNPGKTIVWGGLYWQYFEQIDRIKAHETPLKINRSLLREVLTPSGPVLEHVTTQKPLLLGEKMVMRIELKVDRDLEYIHMKDLRAPAFEPLEQISGYKYHGGLGYYENPRDLATHFFFQYLPKGTWVFEYPVVVSQTGNFSTGITTIQCLYAPEFTSHSEGIRIKVE